MRAIITLLFAFTAATAAAPPPSDVHREIDNVAAFARLYGVVRYFYPADAATTVDWDRLTVLGVSRVRSARDTAALETTLEELFGSLGPGIEIGKQLTPAPPNGPIDAGLVAWELHGPGNIGSMARSPYSAVRTLRQAQISDEFVSVSQNVAAENLRGKRIRLRGRARVANLEAPGWAGLWLRVDRPAKQIGFFDNMQDRPIRDIDWREQLVEGPVADDATKIAFGVLAAGATTADFDALELAVGDNGTWTPLQISDPGFEATGDVREGGWQQGGTSRSPHVGKVREAAADGQAFLRICAVNSSGMTQANTRTASGAHADFQLGQGLEARVPLALPDADARSSNTGSIRSAIDAIPATSGRSDLDVRLADVVVAWSVFRHFYPYWEEAGVDWDTRLVPQLEAAYAASTREAHRRALQQLVADARDGHGNVADKVSEPRGGLPIRFRALDGQLVVSASRVPDKVPVGAVVTAIDGVRSTERLASEMRLVSGTTQWCAWRATKKMATCVPDSTTRITIKIRGGDAHEVSLECESDAPDEKRPEQISELGSGIWYVDLSRASMAEIRPVIPKLAAATGIVFDLRGYPTDAGSQILPYLIAAPESDRWMHVANISGPFGQVADWEDLGWDLQPAKPRFAGRCVFLTDGRAISYAESVMGYVKDRKLGTIIGSTTAGANGNVVGFIVPGGFTITFTGMRVTRHDGHTPHHLAGVQPDITLEPTIAGLQAGRDELLERGTALIRGN